MFFGSSGGGFFFSPAGESGEGLVDPGGAGFANNIPAANKPARSRRLGLNIGKETSKQFCCPMRKEMDFGLRTADRGLGNGKDYLPIAIYRTRSLQSAIRNPKSKSRAALLTLVLRCHVFP